MHDKSNSSSQRMIVFCTADERSQPGSDDECQTEKHWPPSCHQARRSEITEGPRLSLWSAEHREHQAEAWGDSRI